MVNSYAAKEDLCSQFLRILPVCTSDTFVASGAGAYRSIWESCVFKINIMTYIFISIFNSTMICQLKSPLVVVAELCHIVNAAQIAEVLFVLCQIRALTEENIMIIKRRFLTTTAQ